MTARRHTWVPYVAAAAGACLTLKVVLILASSDGIPDAPLVVLYLGGILIGLVAAVGAGLRQERVGRRIAVGFGSAVLLVAWIMGLGDMLEPLISRVSDAEYVGDEVPILVAGLVLLALAYRARSRDLAAEPVLTAR